MMEWKHYGKMTNEPVPFYLHPKSKTCRGHEFLYRKTCPVTLACRADDGPFDTVKIRAVFITILRETRLARKFSTPPFYCVFTE